MVISGTKSKAASQCGYFDATFNRILQVHIWIVYIQIAIHVTKYDNSNKGCIMLSIEK